MPAEEHVVAGAPIQRQSDGAEGKTRGVDGVIAGAAVDDQLVATFGIEDRHRGGRAIHADDARVRKDRDDLVAGRAVDRDAVHRAVAAACAAGKIDMDASYGRIGPAEIVDHDVVGAAQRLESDQLDVVQVHGDVGDVAGETHPPAVG